MTEGGDIVGEPDRGLSSDDMLRAAHDEVAAPPPRPKEAPGESPAVQDEGTEPNPDAAEATHTDGRQTPMVTSCVIHRSGSLWEQFVGEGYQLLIDGQETAHITTTLEEPHRRGAFFIGAPELRSTEVVFADNRFWGIEAVEPRPRNTKTTILGNTKDVFHPIGSRVITVSEHRQPIANSDGPIPTSKKKSCVVVADGKRLTLSPPRKAKKGAIDKQAPIRRDGLSPYSAWSLTASSPVPLSVVLLYWHVLLGDWSAGGVGR